MIQKTALRFFSLLLLLCVGVFGSPKAETKHVSLELLSEYTTVSPDQRFWAGFKFDLIPHWHIYWKNPGDSGQAPEVRWELPEGFNAGPIEWPTPQKIILGPAVNYGYEEEVVFLVPLTTGKNVPDTFELKAHVTWLVCEKICIPEEATLTLTLNGGVPSVLSENNKKTFQNAHAELPVKLATPPQISFIDGDLKLNLSEAWPEESISDLWLASSEWGIVSSENLQQFTVTSNGVELLVSPGEVFSPELGLNGILVLEEKLGDLVVQRGFHVDSDIQIDETGLPMGFWVAMLSAFVGGLILNLMPCVLPILTIKVLNFVKDAQSSRRVLALHGFVFTSGVLLSFLALAALLIGLRAGGEALGWGFQLQSPFFISMLGILMLLIGLNLSGVFEFGQELMQLGQTQTSGNHYSSSFASGVLAVTVASPCTAPFMGAALGFAMVQPFTQTMLIFLALGVGFALPVLLLSLFPAWLKLIPKPGNWMLNLKQIFAFPMYATAAWLVWVASQQVSSGGFALVLAALLSASFAAWMYGRTQYMQISPRIGKRVAMGFIILALALSGMVESGKPVQSANSQDYAAWSPEKVEMAMDEKRPVFVNFTAAWCITCQVNEQIALRTDAVETSFKDFDIAYFKGDWTTRDSKITKELEKYGRSGVPLYLLHIPGREEPEILPQILTESIVLEALSKINSP